LAADLTAKRPKPPLKKVLPEIWQLVKPRRFLLAISFLLMVINRAAGLVLPASTKDLIDKVMVRHQMNLLPVIVGVVAGATLIQGITSYSLTQLLSKAGQRLIIDGRVPEVEILKLRQFPQAVQAARVESHALECQYAQIMQSSQVLQPSVA